MLPFQRTVPFLGPHTVGTTEYEIPVSEIDPTAPAPDSRVSTIKFRLFYPTDAENKGRSISWVPAPQKQWTEAFGRFLGASLGWSSVVNPLLSLMSYLAIPAVADAPLRPNDKPYPLLIFSHGLAGNCNTYSTICGSLASCGIVVAAPEHRDGSSPVSFIRDASGAPASQIDYRKYAHTPTPDVFNARNTQLRTRLWELDLIYTTLKGLSDGKSWTNYALAATKEIGPDFTAKLDFNPGRVTWAGHSFGACTMTQFVKSIYYHHALPSLSGTPQEHDPAYAPLFVPRSGSPLIEQVTSSSPMALLDVWTMPFRAPSAQWLWERPLPCYEKPHSSKGATAVSVMSTEFYNWTELLKRTQALLSSNPSAVAHQLSGEPRSPRSPKLEDVQPKTPTFATPPNKHSTYQDDDEVCDDGTDLLPPASLALDADSKPAEPLERRGSPAPSVASSTASSLQQGTSTPGESLASSTTSLSPSITAKPLPPTLSTSSAIPERISPPAQLFHIPHTAHLSQSDFGPLFPTLTRLLMKAVDPLNTIEVNVRAMTQTMRNAGLDVRRVDEEVLLKEKQRKSQAGSWLGGWWSSKPEGQLLRLTPDEEQDQILQLGSSAHSGRSDNKSRPPVGLERWVELEIPCAVRP